MTGHILKCKLIALFLHHVLRMFIHSNIRVNIRHLTNLLDNLLSDCKRFLYECHK